MTELNFMQGCCTAFLISLFIITWFYFSNIYNVMYQFQMEVQKLCKQNGYDSGKYLNNLLSSVEEGNIEQVVKEIYANLSTDDIDSSKSRFARLARKLVKMSEYELRQMGKYM